MCSSLNDREMPALCDDLNARESVGDPLTKVPLHYPEALLPEALAGNVHYQMSLVSRKFRAVFIFVAASLLCFVVIVWVFHFIAWCWLNVFF